VKATATAARTVALWGVCNAILVAVLVGFGENVPVMIMAASMVGLVFVLAAVVWIGARREEGRHRCTRSRTGTAS
jgi:hypothetical protein